MGGASRLNMRPSLPMMILLGAALLHAPPASAARKLVSHQGLTAYMPDKFSCAEKVTIFVTGNRASFSGEKIGLQRLAGGVRATLGFECSTPIRAIIFIGVSGKKEVWRGLAAESNDWVLVDLSSGGGGVAKSPGAGAPANKQATGATTPRQDLAGSPVESLSGGAIRLDRGRTRTSWFATLP